MGDVHTVKIFGYEIQELNDQYLLKYYKICLFLLPFYLLFGVGFALGFVAMICALVAGEFPSEMAVVIFMCLGGAIAFISVAVSFLKKVKPMKQEINSRDISEEDREMANSSLKKILITCILILVISVIAIFSIIGKSVGGKGGSSGSVTCPNCGAGYRSGHSAADFVQRHGYCSSCQGR